MVRGEDRLGADEASGDTAAAPTTRSTGTGVDDGDGAHLVNIQGLGVPGHLRW